MSNLVSGEDGRHLVQVARDGKPYTGTYVVEGEAVKVDYHGEIKIAPLDGLDAESRAHAAGRNGACGTRRFIGG
jgi:hypothetical protein